MVCLIIPVIFYAFLEGYKPLHYRQMKMLFFKVVRGKKRILYFTTVPILSIAKPRS